MNNKCEICSGVDLEFLYYQNFNNTSGISLMKSYDVCFCKNCGFIFANNIPTQEEFNKYYKEMSKWEAINIDDMFIDKYSKHFKNMFNYINKFARINKNSKILDIGCSTGGFLNEFKKRGFNNLLGLDPSEKAIETTKKLYNIDGIICDIFSFETDKKFDLITMSAVLEHIVDINKLMEKINSLLSDNGYLFIEVPDATQFQDFIYTPYQQFSIEHLKFFTPISIRKFLSNHKQLQIINIKQTQHKLNKTIDPSLFVICNLDKFIKYDLQNIKNYIKKSKKLDTDLKNRFNIKLNKEDKIILWGVGTFTLRLLNDIDLSKISYFVDSNPKLKDKLINGLVIKSPQEIIDNLPILIGSYSFQNEIEHNIRNKYKLSNRIIKLYE
jgi:2-polyprenyl-3-methyl-5-hydroxy-6-metoxy-1,4-benzoquinol methylase